MSDGRQLGFAEYGDARGAPVLYFHGWPGSRLEPSAVPGLGLEPGVRLLALDRPGYGLSDFQSRRRLVDWPQDVSEFADHLNLGRFGVIGVSGGGPYAAACAAIIPDRLSSVTMVASIAPVGTAGITDDMVLLNRLMLRVAQRAPWLARTLVGLGLERMRHFPGRFLPREIEARLPESDKQALAMPGVRVALSENFQEGLRQGVHGAVWDGWLYAKAWGFRLQDIAVPVSLWHGEADIVVPPAMGRYCARIIPQCRADFCAKEGHFSLPLNHFREILGSAV